MKFFSLLSLVALISAAPYELTKRDAATCGNVHYSDTAVSAAANASCSYVMAGKFAGSSNYPHQYKNLEGFKFKGLPKPFYEFPIKSSGIYDGGTPGADRVIVTKQCAIAGVITHTGAPSRNGFVACVGTS